MLLFVFLAISSQWQPAAADAGDVIAGTTDHDQRQSLCLSVSLSPVLIVVYRAIDSMCCVQAFWERFSFWSCSAPSSDGTTTPHHHTTPHERAAIHIDSTAHRIISVCLFVCPFACDLCDVW